MRVLVASDYPVMPWKNGGGETREILLSPAGASLADFDWRISIARVDGDGPFSAFEGIDRTLTVLAGAMTLRDAAGRATRLDAASPPFAFDGGQAIGAVVSDGPVVDLNVMTRRARHSHRVDRTRVSGDTTLVGHAPVTLLIALEDGLRCAGARLARHDGVMIDPGESVSLAADPAGVAALLIEIAERTPRAAG